jgi:hypothetical protein
MCAQNQPLSPPIVSASRAFRFASSRTYAATHDVKLVRASKGIPKAVNIFGYLFNIETDEFTLVVEDRQASLG